jgi:hypothetical protein
MEQDKNHSIAKERGAETLHVVQVMVQSCLVCTSQAKQSEFTKITSSTNISISSTFHAAQKG